MTNIAMPQHKNPFPGWGHEIYSFDGLFLGHHNYALSLSEPCPRVEKKIFLRHTSILHFISPKLPLVGGVGVMNLQFLVSLLYRYCTLNLVRIGLVVLQKKMLTQEAQSTTQDKTLKSFNVYICINCTHLLKIHVGQIISYVDTQRGNTEIYGDP